MGPETVELNLVMRFNFVSQWIAVPDSFFHLPHGYPLLQDIYLPWCGSDDVTARNLASKILCGWADLRSTRTHALTPAAYKHLADLPNLQQVHLFEEGCEALKTFPPTLTPTFPGLRRMRARIEHLSFITTMIQGMQRSPLAHIEILTTGTDCPINWDEIFASIREHCDTSTLVDIHAEGLYGRSLSFLRNEGRVLSAELRHTPTTFGILQYHPRPSQSQRLRS